MPNDPNVPAEVVIETKTTLPGAALQVQATRYLQMVEEYVIDSPETLQSAADDRNAINDRMKALEEQRQLLKAPILEAGRRIDAFLKPVTDTLANAVQIIGRKMATYTEAEQRRIADEQRLAREQAEREAAGQRAAAAKAQAEANEKAEALRKQAEDARAAGKSGQAAKLESKADSAQVAGADKAAALNLQAELTATAPVAVQQAPKVAGVGIEYGYSAKVIDLVTFVRWIVEKRPDLIVLLEVKESALNAQARSLREALSFEGVELVKSPKVRDTRR